MSPHQLGAKLSDYYPAISTRQQLKAMTMRLALGRVDDVEQDTFISPTLYAHTRQQLGESVEGVFKAHYGSPHYDLSVSLKRNTSQFAAHKAACFTEWMRGKSTKEQEPIRRIFLTQLTVEQNLASRASRAARQWQTLVRDRDQYPNLEYLPSRSVAKRENHTRYYGLVLPIGHSFWNSGLPPNGWNCKCRVRPTDKRPAKAMTPPKPVKGIAGNAGKDGEIFTQNHPFFRNVKDKDVIHKAWMKLERKSVRKWTQANIEGKTFYSSQGAIHVNGTGIKKIIYQGHEFEWEQNMLLYDIKTVIKQAEFVKSVPFISSKKAIASFDEVLYFRIQLQGKDSYLVVRKQKEEMGGNLVLYDITEQIK